MTRTELIKQEMQRYGDRWGNIIRANIRHLELSDWAPFMIWTRTRVYYQNGTGIGSVPRNP